MIQNEVSILRRVKHPNIVLLIEEMDVPTELYLVMELVKVHVLPLSCLRWAVTRTCQHCGKNVTLSFDQREVLLCVAIFIDILLPNRYFTYLPCRLYSLQLTE